MSIIKQKAWKQSVFMSVVPNDAPSLLRLRHKYYGSVSLFTVGCLISFYCIKIYILFIYISWSYANNVTGYICPSYT